MLPPSPSDAIGTRFRMMEHHPGTPIEGDKLKKNNSKEMWFFLWCIKIPTYYTPETNNFWVWAYFQGRTVGFREGKDFFFCDLENKKRNNKILMNTLLWAGHIFNKLRICPRPRKISWRQLLEAASCDGTHVRWNTIMSFQ